MSLILVLASVLAPEAQACAMPHEALVMVEPTQVAPRAASLADVFAEIDRAEADNAAKDAIKKALEGAGGVGSGTIPEAAAPPAPPAARPST